MYIKYLTSTLFTSIFFVLSASNVLENEDGITKSPFRIKVTICSKALEELEDIRSLPFSAHDAVKKMQGNISQ